MDKNQIIKEFISPTAAYRGKPFWSWNGELRSEELVRQAHVIIKGIFTDEPHRGHCFDNKEIRDGVMSCAMCWTDDIFEEFEKRYGFACRPILPELFYKKNGESVAPVKLHYIDLADNLFLERFAILR